MFDTNELMPNNFSERKEMSTLLVDNVCKAEFPDNDSSRVDFRSVSDQVTACAKQNLATGDAIHTPCNYRYERLHGASPDVKSDDFCVVVVSTGWIPATVVEDWNPEEDRTPQRVWRRCTVSLPTPSSRPRTRA